eukprot:TRINITY_DN18095_c0_g1_i1.p1 TRINITY_DN18095_c0_g1~~TRINITY_DN18095_c0_g1_i1.p1  ORF type:complete len:163 (+),score=49.66 TRINITY_DN18095_c0_g1_i1:55-489(+)
MTDPVVATRTLWAVLQRDIAAEGVLTDALMQDLNALFEKVLPAALEILDRGWVHRVVSQSGRWVSIVKGRAQSQYVCIGDFCPCQFYQHHVLTGEVLLCKHLLAVQLRQCLRPPLKPKEVTDAEYAWYIATPATVVNSPARKPL